MCPWDGIGDGACPPPLDTHSAVGCDSLSLVNQMLSMLSVHVHSALVHSRKGKRGRKVLSR